MVEHRVAVILGKQLGEELGEEGPELCLSLLSQWVAETEREREREKDQYSDLLIYWVFMNINTEFSLTSLNEMQPAFL